MSCPEAGAARLRVWTLHAPLLLLLLSQGSSALYAADGPVQLLNHQLFGVVEDSPVPCVVVSGRLLPRRRLRGSSPAGGKCVHYLRPASLLSAFQLQEFYAHWDGLCQAIAETYTAVAAELKVGRERSVTQVAAVCLLKPGSLRPSRLPLDF